MIPIFTPWGLFASYVARNNAKGKKKPKKPSNTSATLSVRNLLSVAEMNNIPKAEPKTVEINIL